MSQLSSFPAPVLATPPESKWRSEQRAFQRLLPQLLQTHRGLFVAIHEGQVVESGTDKLEVAGRAYARFGYQPIYVSLVTNEPPPLVRIPSPRFHCTEKPS
jgi:hypothetical protein